MDLLVTSALTHDNGLNAFIPFCGTRDFAGGSSLVIRPNLGSFHLCCCFGFGFHSDYSVTFVMSCKRAG